MRWRRWLLRLLVLLGVAYLYLATLHPLERVADHEYFRAPGPWAIAHRGGRGLWPENTLYAFEKSQALGVDVLEMDLRATADGTIVVMHDTRVDRTTNGSGRVDGMTLAELRKLDAGHRFQDASKEFPFRGVGIAVPTLEEVLARFPEIRLNLEMKQFRPELATKLCGLLKAKSATGRVLVASFDQSAMSTFRRDCPAVATSATTREALAAYVLPRIRLESLYRGPVVALQVPTVVRGREVVEPRFMELTRAWNVRVQVWTVNSEAEMKRLLGMGVQGIITDYPDRLLRLMGRAGT